MLALEEQTGFGVKGEIFFSALDKCLSYCGWLLWRNPDNKTSLLTHVPVSAVRVTKASQGVARSLHTPHPVVGSACRFGPELEWGRLTRHRWVLAACSWVVQGSQSWPSPGSSWPCCQKQSSASH